jgi:hypothetical protein
MFQHYEKLAGADTEEMILSAEVAVIDTRPVVSPESQRWVCICGVENDAGKKFCGDCGTPRDKKAAASQAEIKASIEENMKNPEFLAVLADYLKTHK